MSYICLYNIKTNTMNYLENLTKLELAYYYANLLFAYTGENLTSKDVMRIALEKDHTYFINNIIKLSPIK